MKQTPTAKAQAIIAKFPAQLRECHDGIMNFDVPAQRTINFFFARIGVDRFPGGKDDLWEAITAIEDGAVYEAPPRRLIERWASY